MRVIAGTARGRKLKPVPGDSTRPITDRTKESLFNIIGRDIQDASLLDLFAGTGSVGIEALSRGAAFVRFNDANRQAIETIRQNLSSTGLDKAAGIGRSEIIKTDAFSLLNRAADIQFDYIYIAPPQYHGLWLRALQSIDSQPGWLSSDAWVIVQIHPIEDQAVNLKHLEEFDRRQYGSTLLLFYAHKPGVYKLSEPQSKT
jgi:16S rRNA (guanine(966)-N(2))-methyltransferase RsmD